MPHCTADYAWYFGKFLFGFAGMLFLYVGFLKETEPTCLCLARMREFINRKGENINSQPADDPIAVNATKGCVAKDTDADVKNQSQGRGTKLQAQRRKENLRKSKIAAALKENLHSKNNDDIIDADTTQDVVNKINLPESSESLKTEEGSSQFCSHCGCWGVHRPASLSRRKCIRRKSLTGVHLSKETLAKLPDAQNVSSTLVSCLQGRKKENLPREEETQTDDMKAVKDDKFIQEKLPRGKIRVDVNTGSELNIQRKSSKEFVQFAKKCSQEISVKKEERAVGSQIQAEYNEECYGDPIFHDTYTWNKKFSNDQNFPQSSTKKFTAKAKYNEKCYCCSYCKQSRKINNEGPIVNGGFEIKNVNNNYYDTDSSRINEVRRKIQQRQDDCTRNSFDDSRINNSIPKYFKYCPIDTRQLPKNTLQNEREFRPFNQDEKMFRRIRILNKDRPVYSAGQEKTIEPQNSELCQNCLRDNFLQSRLKKSYVFPKSTPTLTRRIFRRSSWLDKNTVRSLSCPRDLPGINKNSRMGKTRSYINTNSNYENRRDDRSRLGRFLHPYIPCEINNDVSSCLSTDKSLCERCKSLLTTSCTEDDNRSTTTRTDKSISSSTDSDIEKWRSEPSTIQKSSRSEADELSENPDWINYGPSSTTQSRKNYIKWKEAEAENRRRNLDSLCSCDDYDEDRERVELRQQIKKRFFLT